MQDANSHFQTFELSNFQTHHFSHKLRNIYKKKTVSQIKCKKKLSFTTEYTKFATHKKNYGT